MPPINPNLTGEDLDQAIADAARCKGMRYHRFDPIDTPTWKEAPSFGSLITYRCETCGTLRFDKVSRLTGERISTPQYVQPQWYRDALVSTRGHDAAWWRARFYDGLDPDLFAENEQIVVPLKRRKTG